MASFISERLFQLTSKESRKAYILFSLAISIFTSLAVWTYELHWWKLNYSEESEIFNLLNRSLVWRIPFAIIINLGLLFISFRVTAHMLRFASAGSKADAFFIPVIDFIFSIILVLIGVLFLDLIPLFFGAEVLGELSLPSVLSYDYLHIYLTTVLIYAQVAGGAFYSGASVVLIPSLLFYSMYFFLFAASIFGFILRKIFSRIALMNSYNEFGERPITAIGVIINGILIIIKMIQLTSEAL